MTNPTSQASQDITSSIEERIEILARELELAVKWQRPCILLVVYSSEYMRSDVETALENYLMDLGQKALRLQLKHQPTETVVSFLREFKDPANTVFLVNGLHWGQDEGTGAYSTLNLQREFFVERQIRAIFWLTENEIVNLARFAPDFWAYRHRVIEFIESPKAERLLQQALESAWQGTGEYGEPYEDTDAKISLRESLLTELPQGEEASSLRANMLLTLGVLNWRKGDFEKASQQLQDALKIASRMEDNWFEAECYNAMALIKTSTDCPDEAIDAYKRAIQLAPDQIFAWNNLGNLCARIGRNDEAMIAFRKAVDGNPKDPIAWTGLANLHFRLGYMDDAIAAYRKAIQFMPTFAQPWNGLGDVYAGMGRSDEAMKAYHKAIELNKQYITPWVRLAVLYTKQERYREAVRAYQRALALDANNSRLWNDLGIIYLKSEALPDAVESFLKAIDLDRGYGWAYSNLAYTYTLQGRYKETVSLLLRSIELLQTDQDKAVSWNRLGSVYRLLGDYDNAIAAYQMADQLDLAKAGSRQSTAQLLAEAASRPETAPAPLPEQPERTMEAEIEDELAETRPTAAVNAATATPAPVTTELVAAEVPDNQPAKVEQPAAQNFMDAPAWLFVPQDSNESVETVQPEMAQNAAVTPQQELPVAPAPKLEQPAVAATPDVKEAGTPNKDALKWNEEGNDCFKRGEFAAAVNAYNKAIQADTTFGIPYSNLALAYVSQGRSSDAVLLYQRSIELLQSDSDKAVCWNGLGNAYRCLNDYKSAMDAYQKAAELDPSTAGIRDRADDYQATPQPRDAQGWNELGELFTRSGSAHEAVSAFEHAIELEPESGKNYDNLARTLVSQNKFQEAIPLYQKSIQLLQDNKEKAATWNKLGNVYRKLNDYDNAIKAYQKAVVLADEGVDLLTRTRFSLLSNCYVNP